MEYLMVAVMWVGVVGVQGESTGAVGPAEGVRIFAPDGSRIEAPAGSRVQMELRDRGSEQRPTLERTERAMASGVGVTARGEEVKVGQENQANRAALEPLDALGVGGGGAAAEGGASKMTLDVVSGSAGPAVLYVIGALMVCGGALGLWKGLTAIGWGMICGGGLVIGCGVLVEQFAWVFLVAALVGVGLAVWLIYEGTQKRRKEMALEPMVRAVAELEKSDPELAAKVKAKIAEQTDYGDEAVQRSVVREVKKRLGVA